jgi:hypothetical protein
VSDRDFALDYLMAAAQTALHLSRLAEEFIIWASQPFGFVRLPDSLSTGSSIMPQKKNPDAAELVRGHSGRIVGCLTALMITMKGLPLAYSKDMQDDKPPVFEAAGLLTLCIAAMTGMVQATTFRTDRMRGAAEFGVFQRLNELHRGGDGDHAILSAVYDQRGVLDLAQIDFKLRQKFGRNFGDSDFLPSIAKVNQQVYRSGHSVAG